MSMGVIHNSKRLHSIGKWRPAYQDDAERLFQPLAVQAVQLYVKTKYCRQRNNCDYYFTMLYHSFQLSKKQASFSSNVAARAE